MDVLKQLLGRLHPIIVHLPIGFVLAGLLLQWYGRKKNELGKVAPLLFFWGGISAVLACITGYLQYLGEGYAFDTIKLHLWSGIATALFCFVMVFRLKGSQQPGFLQKVPILFLSIFFFILISVTGHFGGSITHGEDYLVEPLPNHLKSALGFETYEEKTIALNEENWQEAQLYEEVIKPILNNKCVSCHNPKKEKGELQLHSQEGILKGGENGGILVVSEASRSELFIRMDLPKDNEDHMPPKDKTQPTKEEIRLVGAWIDAGHPFDKSIGETGLEKELFLSFFPQKLDNDFPDIDIVAAASDSIRAIEQQGVHVDPISKATSFLQVSCINKPAFTDADFELLLPLVDQIAILDLGGTQVTDSIFGKLTALPHLTVLKLDHTEITGKNIEQLSILEHLKSINLTHSKFGEPHLSALSTFKKLRTVYVYNTLVKSDGAPKPDDGKIYIDYGDYEVPALPSDSIVY